MFAGRNWNFKMDTEIRRKKQIARIVRPICTLIVSLVLMLTIPILSGVIALPFFIIGQPEAYIVSRLIQNLYGPLIIIILGTVLKWISPSFLIVCARGAKIHKFNFKNILIAFFMIALVTSITYNSFKNYIDLILDIGIVATSNYSQVDGKLKLYEASVGDDDQTFMEVNGIKFSGGNAKLGDLKEGDYYHVEYLPHTKYVVKYQLKK